MAPKKQQGLPYKAEEKIIEEIAKLVSVHQETVQDVLNGLRLVAEKELKTTQMFVLPRLVMLKLVHKPAKTAKTMMVFGKKRQIKATPAITTVKTLPMPYLKRALCASIRS